MTRMDRPEGYYHVAPEPPEAPEWCEVCWQYGHVGLDCTYDPDAEAEWEAEQEAEREAGEYTDLHNG